MRFLPQMTHLVTVPLREAEANEASYGISSTTGGRPVDRHPEATPGETGGPTAHDRDRPEIAPAPPGRRGRRVGPGRRPLADHRPGTNRGRRAAAPPLRPAATVGRLVSTGQPAQPRRLLPDRL